MRTAYSASCQLIRRYHVALTPETMTPMISRLMSDQYLPPDLLAGSLTGWSRDGPIEFAKTQSPSLLVRVLAWAKEKVPPVFRSILGLLFMVGGVFGFLPVLGFGCCPWGWR